MTGRPVEVGLPGRCAICQQITEGSTLLIKDSADGPVIKLCPDCFKDMAEEGLKIALKLRKERTGNA